MTVDKATEYMFVELPFDTSRENVSRILTELSQLGWRMSTPPQSLELIEARMPLKYLMERDAK